MENTTEYILILGPKRDSLSSVIPVTVIYVLIFITGLTGNICTCIIIARNKYMHTATNFYLFSLAISDLLLLLFGLPQELYEVWNKYPYVFGEVFCIIRGFTAETSTNASILTITSFTMERYLAICHPLRVQTMSKLPRVIKVIVLIWILGILCAAPLAIQFGIVYLSVDDEKIPETAQCSVKNPLPHAFEVSTFTFFILPVAVISGLYTCIGIRLRSDTISNNDSIRSTDSSYKNAHKPLRRESTRTTIRSNGSTASRKSVIKMLVAVVVAFFLCWAPFHAQRLLAIYVKNPSPTEILIYRVLTYISGVTYYVSATINPILYSIMSVKFRQAFKDSLAQCFNRSPSHSAKFSFSSRFNSTIHYEYPMREDNKFLYDKTGKVIVITEKTSKTYVSCVV